MKIGVPKEVKNNEFRVGLTPESASKLIDFNHEVFIQTNAGAEIGFFDSDYETVGANIVNSAEELYAQSELIVKVKEPVPEEFKYLRNDQTVFAYLHLAGDPVNGLNLTKTGITGIALETVTADDGSMPLLSPMSEIAGHLSVIVGSYFLLKPNRGMGTLIGSINGLEPRTITIIGAGVAGTAAIKKAIDNRAKVKVIDLSSEKLNLLKDRFGSKNIDYIISSEKSIEDAIKESDMVIGAVYVIGKQAPKVIKRSMLKLMKPGSVMVDISIDQGGCFESSKPTTHDDPTYDEGGIIHYCVTNMPGAVPLTATESLNKATLPYILELANKGIETALKESSHLASGLNIQSGEIIHESVREALINT